jgi:NhaP-type Na+/H+ or K+/H+ antiporter
MEWSLALIAVSVLAVAAISRPLSDSPVTPAMVIVAIGVIAGPRVLDSIDVSPLSSSVRTLAEATLTVVLFGDAARIDLRAIRRDHGLPVRLLAIGLPLTIAAGAGLALALFGALSLTEALVLAIVLAPTDAALGQSVVTEPRLPLRIRQGLNIESGLNDGICVPLLLIALAGAQASEHTASAAHVVRVVGEEIGYGLAGGLAAGGATAVVVIVGARRNLISPAWRPVIPVAGAGLAYGVATALGGSGFIAAFDAGLTFTAVLRRDPHELLGFNEQLGNLLDAVTFVAFGAILLGPALGQVTWSVALYAVLSLTVVRMLPVAIALIGSGARWPTRAFVGWFGPRGLASIVFAVLVVEEADLPQTSTIVLVTYITVGLSVFAHGATAAPLAARYAAWYERHSGTPHAEMEDADAAELRTRGAAAHALSPSARTRA